jgi:hypothetical protein
MSKKQKGLDTKKSDNSRDGYVSKPSGDCKDADTAQKELDCWYGDGAPVNPHREKWMMGIAWWQELAERNNMPWALARGTALGQYRHPMACFIPDDDDMDFYVGKEAVDILKNLAKDETNKAVSFAGKTKDYREPRVIVYPNMTSPFTEDDEKRPRWDCKDERNAHKTDRCSFNGLVARVLVPPDFYMDFVMYYSSDKEKDYPEGAAKEGCWTYKGKSGCDHVPADKGTELMDKTEECDCNGLKVSCLKKDRNVNELEGFYNEMSGGDMTQPASKWNSKKKDWEDNPDILDKR